MYFIQLFVEVLDHYFGGLMPYHVQCIDLVCLSFSKNNVYTG